MNKLMILNFITPFVIILVGFIFMIIIFIKVEKEIKNKFRD
ncbi:hypothetical protein bsdtb5_35960 [Anaeromicropila herbilytica]|uniref:Uncharacterized protein n=1 Tax=Anaeromicropila herbilytica TaxID=2785025 RepID=A0A7R7IER5_9FIRM|nr:hypothetical protein bsdtb5_35960 [Anaeromicropila herbilytica]